MKAKEKPIKITDAKQRVAVDFLEALVILLYFNKDFNGNVVDQRPLEDRLDELIAKYTEKYQIESDPFTSFPCTTKEYFVNLAEYNRQAMEAKFGYYED